MGRDDVAGGGDRDAMVRPSVSGGLSIGNLCPVVDPLVGVLSVANSHSRTSDSDSSRTILRARLS